MPDGNERCLFGGAPQISTREDGGVISYWVLLGILTCGAGLAATPSRSKAAEKRQPVITRQQIEADWFLQDQVRQKPAAPTPHANVTPREDARGAVDGVKDGTWGIHTGKDEKPWWCVDLGAEMLLDRVLVYNTGYQSEWKRAAGLMLLLSSDGKTWREMYRHNGQKFQGPKEPLTVRLQGAKARYVRIQLPVTEHLVLEEVEVYIPEGAVNVALHKPADQSSSSTWSTRGTGNPWSEPIAPLPLQSYPVAEVIERGRQLASNLREMGAGVDVHARDLERIAEEFARLRGNASTDLQRETYLRSRWAVRELALANPLLEFKDLLLVKRAHSIMNCHCDQGIAWWSRPGGELVVLEDFKSDSPRLRSLTAGLAPGDILRPDISYDGAKVLFAYCRHYPELVMQPNKLDKAIMPEDSFYHLYEMNLDGSGLRQLTHGRYNDFDGCYLPSGQIVFLSTRRGQFIQCGQASAQSTSRGVLPDSFVRCGGNEYRPCSVYTLHAIDGDGRNMRAISAFESFEWTPSVASDGRILYARWDYVDRHKMWHMGLWSTLPNGMAAQAVFGNFTKGPYSLFEARSVPNSQKIVFTASAHHSHFGGSLVLLDTHKGVDGDAGMKRLTPEVPFPEWEGWGKSYYANPYPLSEQHYLVAWSSVPLANQHANGPSAVKLAGPKNALGVYLLDAFGNLNMIYRDPDISSMYPLPIRPRHRPLAMDAEIAWEAEQEGRMLLQDVYQGDLAAFPRGSIHRLRIVGVPPKTQPFMNEPSLGVMGDDPGKFVLGSVPVEPDGSAYFRVPSGVPVFFQALNEKGMAVQTMRSVTYVQPGQTYSCIGCHEHRQTAPPGRRPLASLREPSQIRIAPEGAWPLDFQVLVQPVLDEHCVRCHQTGVEGEGSKTNLLSAAAYNTLVDFGGEHSLREHVQARYDARRSVAGAGGAMSSPLTNLLEKGHYEVKLNGEDRERLNIWMDAYAQRAGSYSVDQQQQLRQLQNQWAPLLTRR